MFNHTEELRQELASELKDKGESYQARTRYLDENQQPVYINRLIREDSPYLLQHAHNPVDWYPWGDDAFAAAKQGNKPVFLSIGYSTCHWCHVMEEESFDNEDVAKHMNEHFICIKIDRELQPDVDTFYMTAVMLMQGHGGWPMSSFLTADRKPFFGGTYYQPAQFITLMNQVNDAWHKQKQDILEQADSFSQHITNAMASKQSLNEIGTNVIDLTAKTIMNHYDIHNGGFGQAPKFPNEPYLYFLLEYAVYSGNAEVLNAVVNTLHIQACGGIYDQIAGGFHRYATDPNWLIPHFEKMLYNQANLSYIFTRAYQITGTRDFKRIACETLGYVLREMCNDGGGFYSATDADSEGKEGLFFVWDQQEIELLLDDSSAREFINLYQITKSGNFEEKNIPNLRQPLTIYAYENNIDYAELIERLNQGKKVLWESRKKRIPPLRDDKVITAWNGMMIKTFAYAGQQLQQQDYIDSAIHAANYVLDNNKTKKGELSRSSLEGKASIPALQEDYAYLAEAVLQIYDATLDKTWLKQAMQLTDKMITLFWDNDQGGFFMGTQSPGSLLPSSPKEINDNATASGNSVALRVLVKLAKRTEQQHYENHAQQIIRAYSEDITQRPYSCAYLICGLLELQSGEQADTQWAAQGNVHININVNKDNDIYKATLEIKINDGWHLNQLKEGAPVMIKTNEAWRLNNIDYPEPVNKIIGSQDKPVIAYEGILNISFELSRDTPRRPSLLDNILKLKISLQACEDQRCLAPEDLNLIIPV